MVLEIHQEQTKTSGTHFFPRALLYRGAAPWEDIDALACRSIWDHVAQIIEDETWCYERRDELSEALFRVIAGLSEEQVALRRRVIQAKRDLYNLQLRTQPEIINAIGDALSPGEQALLHNYWERIERLSATKTRMQDDLEQQFTQARLALWDILRQTPALFNGIALIAPELLEQAGPYLTAMPTLKQAKLEKEEISLLLYLVRMVTKTSAFSTFTSLALARVIINEGTHSQLLVPDETAVSIARVNQLPLVLITNALARHPEIRRSLTIRINPYLKEQDGQLTNIRMSTQTTHMRRVAFARMEKISLAMTGAVRILLSDIRVAQEANRPLTLDQAAEGLLVRTTPTNREETRQRIEQIVQQLVDLQIIQFDLSGLQTIHCIHDIIARLVAIPPTTQVAHEPILAALRQLEAIQQNYPQRGPQERSATVRTIGGILENSFQALEMPSHPRLFQPALYENSILKHDDIILTLPNPERSSIVKDFQTFGGILPLFRNATILMSVLTSFFVERYGQGGCCQDVTGFFLDVCRQFSDDDIEKWSIAPWEQAEPPAAIRRYTDEAWELVALRTQLLQRINQHACELDAQPQRETSELVLQHAWLEEIAQRLPSSLRSQWTQYAYMCQTVPQEHGDLFIVNRAADGWGKQLGIHSASFCALYGSELHAGESDSEDIVSLMRKNLQSIPVGHEFVEMIATNGFNGNMHPPTTRRALLLPGEWTQRPSEQLLLLSDLVLEHDKEQNRLRLVHKREQTEIHLLYQGMLATMLMGPLQRWLIPFTQSTHWSDIPFTEAFMGGKKDDTTRIHVYPRVSLGQLVLARRKWMIPAAQWPQWESRKRLDGAQLLEIERWRRQAGLPVQLYVRPALAKRVKPQFVDFHHAFILAALPKRLRSQDGWFKAEEALPAPMEYHQTHDGKHRVSTFWIEPR